MRKLTLLLLVPFLFFSCKGQENESLTQKIQGEGNRSLILTAGPDKPWVGVPFTLELIMKGEKEDDVLFPKVEQDFLPEGLVLKDYHADDNRLTLTVTAEKAGTYSLPPLTILFDNDRGGVELLTRPVNFEVTSLVGEGEEGISPLSSALSIGFLTRGESLILSGVLMGLVLFFFWLFYWRKRKKHIPPEPVWLILERERDNLTGDGNLLEGDPGLFYDRAVCLVKKALDRVYGENTGERTREEFMVNLMSSPFYEPELKAWFSHFFERADMVRFARTSVEKETALRDLDETIRFVNRATEKARNDGEDRS
jgi:hypothetical protein